MTVEQFHASLKTETPPKMSVLAEALWHEGKGNWQKAHELVQDVETREAALIHAYLHRKEGDEGNAAYWYQRAGERKPSVSLQEEWRELVARFL